jgi:hypothetical protein
VPSGLTVDQGLQGQVLSGQASLEWQNVNPGTHSVSLALSADGGASFAHPIASDIDDTGAFSFDTTTMQDGEYVLKVTIQALGGLEITATSAAFSIDNPDAALTFPRGGELISDVRTITWDVRNASATVLVQVSANNGINYETLAAAAPNNGSLAWDASTEKPNQNFRVRLVTDAVSESGDFTVDNRSRQLRPFGSGIGSPGMGNHAAVAVDLNGDKKVDLVTSGDNGTQVHLNTGAGLMSTVQTFDNRYLSLVAGDFNGDGHQDVLASGKSESRLLLNDGEGSLVQGSARIAMGHTATGDIDGDGDLDFVGAGGAIKIGNNDGFGNFTISQLANPDTADQSDCALGDLNGDGHLDLVVARGHGEDNDNFVYRGNGNGSFTLNQGIDSGSSDSIALGDLDGDGDLDAIFGGSDGLGVSIALNNAGILGSAVLNRVTSPTITQGDSILAIRLFDFEGDGDLDALVGGTEESLLLVNDGAGSLGTEQILVGHGSLVRRIAIGDIDGDRAIDVITCSDTQDTQSMLNQIHDD